MRPILPEPPSTRRLFEWGDRVRAVLRVYQRGTDVEDVDVTFRILSDTGIAWMDRHTVSARSFAAAEALIERLLPIEKLSSGPYVLEVEARRPREAETALQKLRFVTAPKP
jgi:hypothetical protein